MNITTLRNYTVVSQEQDKHGAGGSTRSIACYSYDTPRVSDTLRTVVSYFGAPEDGRAVSAFAEVFRQNGWTYLVGTSPEDLEAATGRQDAVEQLHHTALTYARRLLRHA